MKIENRKLTILTMSDNTNSFGLRGVILIDREHAHGYQVGANYLWTRGRAAGDTVNVQFVDGAPHWVGVEIPRDLGPVPQAILDTLAS